MDRETPAPFVHLHLHTEYSLLDGGNRIDRLIKHVKSLGMDAVAMTDHGNLFGAVQFFTKAKAAGIKPILGIEAYVAPGDRTEKKKTGIADGGFHLVLLAENQTGWQHLLKLSSDAYLNGFYFKPRMDKSTLTEWSDGIVAINGHLGSSLAYLLQKYLRNGETEEDWQAAVEEAVWHKDCFGVNEDGEPRFYIEIQRHGVKAQDDINPSLIRLARELDIPIVCDNDSHFMRAEDHDTHDTLICISMGKEKSEPERLHYPEDLYVKSPEQMVELFPDVPEAIENTRKIADRCNVELDFDSNYAPVVIPEPPKKPLPFKGGDRTRWFTEFCALYELHAFDATTDQDVSEDELKTRCDETLRQLSEAGLIWRYGTDGITDDIRARLDRELKILADKSISAYFLIVWDFVNWARQRGIPANARGSGVGTMVGYVLGLSNACPVNYGLLFERFTDPDRSEYPDIDIDICQDGRGAVIDYVRQKYGHVAQIITFGTLKARAAIKDVGRVLGFIPAETQRLANLVPDGLKVTIDDAIAQEPDLKSEYESRPELQRLLDTAREIEGQVRHSGIHAAGVVVATQPLDTIVPLCKPTGSNAGEADVVTQWDGPTVERVGLLKMDFLGLRTLSIIERCKTLVRQTLADDEIRRVLNIDNPDRDPLDLELLTYDDPRVFELFQRGDTAGVFQFESGGMRNLLVDMKPDRLEDLIAANALYRPGPMELIPTYNRRKHNEERVPEVHPIVDRHTAETYGVMVYQEQVMQICHELGGIPLRSAYTLIKAISKKKEKVINAERPVFLDGAESQGLARAKADELFELILKFAGYGFNKSHSTGYSIVAYQTAYLKTYFPNQYMAAVLTYESQAQKVSEWIKYLDDCRRVRFPDDHYGIDVKPPDLNLSDPDFAVVFGPDEPHDVNHGHVRFGLKALKGAGEKAIQAIVEERGKSGPFNSLYNFCERVPLGAVNKATIEALIKAGAFDSLHGIENRAAMAAAVEPAIAAGQALAADKAAGQGSLFGGPSDASDDDSSRAADAADPPLPRITPWESSEALAFEKEVLGFYVSSHPLKEWGSTIDRFGNANTKTIEQFRDGEPIALGGMVTRVRPTMVRRGRSAGQKMAMITVEDLEGSIDGTLFSDVYAQYGGLIQMDAIVFIIGKIDRSRSQPTILVDRVVPIENAPFELAGAIDIEINDDPDEGPALLNHLSGLLQQYAKLNGSQGRPVPVRLHILSNGTEIVVETSTLRVAASESLLGCITDIYGPGSCYVAPSDVPIVSKDKRKRWQKRN